MGFVYWRVDWGLHRNPIAAWDVSLDNRKEIA